MRSLLLLFCAFAIAPGADAAAESVLRSRLNSDIRTTEPGTNRDENTDAVVLHMVEGLVAFREDASVGPLLADSWVVSADGLTYTFKLRPGVKFHNGAPLTADEVVWSFNRYLQPATGWRCLAEFDGHGASKIVSVETVDGLTVAITLDAPSSLFLTNLSRQDCGGTGILHPDSLDKDGSWIAPVGTGPFRFGTWRRNQFIELERFGGYVSRPGPRDGNTGGKKPMVDKIRFMIIPDASAARAALISGALDVLDGVSPNEVADLRGRKDVRLVQGPILDIYAVLVRSEQPPFDDANVRRALAMSIDIAGLTGAVTQDTGVVNASAVPAASGWHTKAHERRIKYDPAAAAALLRKSGYKGQPIKLIANKRYPQMFDGAVLVQAMAQQAGFNVELEVLDWATQLDRYGSGKYQAMTFAYSGRLDPSLGYGAFMGDPAVEPRKVWGSKPARDVLARSMSSNDPKVRQAAFDELHRLMLEDVPLIVMYNPSHIIATRPGVKGVKGWPVVQQRLWNVSRN